MMCHHLHFLQVMFEIEQRHSSSFERASIDEAYVDLTDEVDALFNHLSRQLKIVLEDFDHTLETDVVSLESSGATTSSWCRDSHLPPPLNPPINSSDSSRVSSGHPSLYHWTVSWVAWLDQMMELHPTLLSEESPTAEATPKMALLFRSVWKCLFSSGGLLSLLSPGGTLRSEIVMRATGELVELKGVDPNGKRPPGLLIQKTHFHTDSD